MARNSEYPRRRGFGFVLGRILTAVLGLLLGAFLFIWNTLGTMDYIGIQGVETGSTQGLDDYIDVSEGGKLGKVNLAVDPDYPITKVSQKDPLVENILVFGIDSRGEETARADSIIIVTVDRRSGQIKLTSVLRDTEMNMNDAEGTRHKVNASYAYGGVGMLINTLNYNLDLDIQKFVMFDFWSASGFVDALGGVTLTIAENEVEATNQVMIEMAHLTGQEAVNLTSAGTQKLNGIQAISWARVRKIDSDFGRTSRQRELMEAIIQEFGERNVVRQANFAVTVLDDLVTNMNRTDVMGTGVGALGSLQSVKQYYVPQEGMYETNYDNWNMIYDPAVQVPALHEFIWQKVE